MKLGIMQPYFFPYMGYFDLINKTDRWLVFDVVKFQPKSWMCRNFIQDPNVGKQYIRVPVDKTSGNLLHDVRTSDLASAKAKLSKQLEIYRRSAPHYEVVRDLVERVFETCSDDRLVSLNVAGLNEVTRFLGLEFNCSLCSEMKLDYSDVTHAGQWALEISKQLGADTYVNPPGGVDIFVPEEWDDAGIELAFTTLPNMQFDVYPPFEFRANLSILDALMWNRPEDIVTYLDTLKLQHHPKTTQSGSKRSRSGSE